MRDQDQDWLDDHLAADNYIADDGFTARVITQLPKALPNRAASLRGRILFISAVFSLGLALLLIVPLAGTVGSSFNQLSRDISIPHLVSLFRQPAVLYGGAGCILLLTLASIPFVRRWA
jgi:hypothetical protein